MFSKLEELPREKMLEAIRMFASNTMTVDGL
jgi:hypothetical protein